MLRREVLADETAVRRAASEPSVSAALRCLGLRVHGVNAGAFRSRCADLGIVPPDPGTSAHSRRAVPLEELLVRGRPITSSRFKKRLIAEGVLEDRCSGCGAGPTWQGKPLALQLEHINGDPADNRLENLTILCPNCHSQTTTYAGRNARH